MFASIIGDLVSDIFHKTVKAFLALTFIGICLLGAGFASGTIRPDDLRPERVRGFVAACKDRVHSVKTLTGKLYGVDYTGTVRNLRNGQEDLQDLGGSENIYGNGGLEDTDDGARSEISSEDDVVLSGNY